MEKLNGKRKINVAIFISGRGTNLKSILNFSKSKNSKYIVKLVLCNNRYAKGLNIAKKNKIRFVVVNYKRKFKAEKDILFNLKKNNIDLICLAGFMKILSKKFVDNYKNRILNIHPSLLPKYKGLNTHKKVILNKEKFTGCTIIL